MPIVSVIVPNYNHAKYIQKRIDSILNQTYQDYELIILDDFSNDNSKEIIGMFRNNPKVSKIIYNEKNSGNIVAQWIKGIGYSIGDYIWIAESDDLSDERFLEEQVNILSKHNNCSFVFCNSYKIDETDRIIVSMEKWKNKIFDTYKWSNSYINNGKDELFNYLIYACTINNMSACLFRKGTIKEALINIEGVNYTLDWLLYMKLLYKNDVYYNHSKLNYYREHSNNSSKKNENYSGSFIDRFMTNIIFFHSFDFNKSEKEIVFSQILKEYKGILGAVRIKNIKISDFIKVHKAIKNPFLFCKIFIYTIINKLF